MKRVLFLLLLFAGVARGQGVDEWIEETLDAATSPLDRARLLEKLATAGPDALARLAPRGLDPAASPEVVHAVVATLFERDAYGPHVPDICRLVLAPAHQDALRSRIASFATHERAKPFVEAVVALAKGDGDVELRRAALVALRYVPSRDALEAIVAVGRTEEKLSATALELVRPVLGTLTLERAAALLARTPAHRNYWMIVLERLDEVERFRDERKRYERLYFERSATAPEAIEALTSADVERRRMASGRLRTLSGEKLAGDLKPDALATAVFDAFVASRAEGRPQDAKVFAALCGALRNLAQAPGGETAPLWQSGRTREAVITEIGKFTGDPRFTAPDDLHEAGSAAVNLLRVVGEGVAPALVRFARDFNEPRVRTAAIQELGVLAKRTADQRFVVDQLGRLLAVEKDAAIRRQVLATIAQRDVPIENDGGVLAAVQGLLEPADPAAAPKLEDAELRDCAIVLEQVGTDEALAVLQRVALGRSDARRFAVEKGLLPLAARNGKEPAILAFLKELVANAELPEAERIGILSAIGAQGTRNALPLLDELRASESLSAALRQAAEAARFKLAQQLVKAENVTQENLVAARKVLFAEATAETPNWTHVEALAADIVRAADVAKLPAGNARIRVAQAADWKEPRAPRDQLLKLFEAAAKQSNDGAAEALRAEMLRRYCELLLEPPAPQWEAAIRWCEELGALGSETPAAQADHLLRAAECALQAGRREDVARILGKASKKGLEGERKQRHDRILKDAEKLPGA